MPEFTLSGTAAAPVEEVWKLLFDPARFPEWWVGVETVRVGSAGEYTIWPEGHPDFPVPQSLRGDRTGGRVTMSCQVSDIDFSWQLTEKGGDTRITVRVDIPPAEAHRFDDKREAIAGSLTALARLAEAEALPA
jgi:uncharacterized protein YndB with AHSA1/START domain